MKENYIHYLETGELPVNIFIWDPSDIYQFELTAKNEIKSISNQEHIDRHEALLGALNTFGFYVAYKNNLNK